jgi:Transglycosylase SLT domain
MPRLDSASVLCLALLVASPVIAKTDASIDAGALESRWQTFAKTAVQTRPALEFPYAHCFKRAAATHQLPETLLLAVARGESDFEPKARSDANAYGLMQILWPGTAKHLGLNRLSDLLEPCTNVEAGTRYLKELLERYQGNMHRALAAYNYGPSRIPVSGGKLPDGAVWYSSYIFRHLDYVLNGSRKQPPGGSTSGHYSDQDRLFIIRFARPYRAAAFVDRLQPDFGNIRLDWFRRPDKGFDVVMLYTSEQERKRGQQLLSAIGFQTE